MAKNLPPEAASRIVVIDGLALVGKSATCHIVADKLGFYVFDPATLYRALAVMVLRKGIVDIPILLEILAGISWEGSKVLAGGEDVSAFLQDPDVLIKAAQLETVPQFSAEVAKLFELEMSEAPGLVIEGRMMGLFPKNSHRFFLEAPPQIRAEHLSGVWKQNKREGDLKKALAVIRARDARGKKHGQLTIATGFWSIDVGLVKDAHEAAAAIFNHCQDLVS